jgi:hypothetical protein
MEWCVSLEGRLARERILSEQINGGTGVEKRGFKGEEECGYIHLDAGSVVHRTVR